MSKRMFALVLEKKYDNRQNIILFGDNVSQDEPKMLEVEKYKGITNSKKGKYYMSEIDAITNKFASESDFVKSLKCYLPIHKLFIGVSSKGFVKNIKPVFGNFELGEELKLVKNDKLCGEIILSKKEHLVSMLTGKDERFANVYLKSDYYKTAIVEATVREVRSVRRQYKYLPLDADANFIISTAKERLLEEFDKYHLYRGLFLAHQEYYEKYIKSVSHLQNSETTKEIKPEESKTKKLEFIPYEGEQIKF